MPVYFFLYPQPRTPPLTAFGRQGPGIVFRSREMRLKGASGVPPRYPNYAIILIYSLI
ncbi:MAG: hypothetical protein LBV27_08250 [Oscillospiraceae bacterium]|nr:hypothetical protein [Oscillospiraceae bacterium]